MASIIQIKRGTGSAVPTGLADGELAINLDKGQLYFGSGSTSVNSFRFTNLTAENYIVSTSVTNITTQTLSGSTQFGDSSDDTHQFIGNITASFNISASGNIRGGSILGTIGTAAQPNISSVGILSSLTTTGNISSSAGVIHTTAYNVDGVSALNTNATTGRLFVNSTTTQVDIGKTGAITST